MTSYEHSGAVRHSVPSTAEEEKLKRKVADLEKKNEDMQNTSNLQRESNAQYREELEQVQYQLSCYGDNEEWDGERVR